MRAVDMRTVDARSAAAGATTAEATEDGLRDDVGVGGGMRDACGDAVAAGRWDDARALFTEMALADDPDLLTVPAGQRMP